MLLEPAQRLDRKVLVMWWAIAAAGGLLVTAVGAIVVARDLVPGGIVVPVGMVALALAAAGPYIRYRRWRYEIRKRDLFLARGGIFITRTLIPFDRIQFVETREGPLDRVLDRRRQPTVAGEGADEHDDRRQQAEQGSERFG